MMTTALQTGRTRAQNDLLTAERSLRNQVESNVRDLRQLLLELAVRFDGQRLEALRRDDPSAPTHWSPDDWRSFFSAIQFAVAGWETQKDLRGKRELKRQVEGMRAQIQTLTGQSLDLSPHSFDLPLEFPLPTQVFLSFPSGNCELDG